jgi:hypothetical protein
MSEGPQTSMAAQDRKTVGRGRSRITSASSAVSALCNLR